MWRGPREEFGRGKAGSTSAPRAPAHRCPAPRPAAPSFLRFLFVSSSLRRSIRRGARAASRTRGARLVVGGVESREPAQRASSLVCVAPTRLPPPRAIPPRGRSALRLRVLHTCAYVYVRVCVYVCVSAQRLHPAFFYFGRLSTLSLSPPAPTSVLPGMCSLLVRER